MQQCNLLVDLVIHLSRVRFDLPSCGNSLSGIGQDGIGRHHPGSRGGLQASEDVTTTWLIPDMTSALRGLSSNQSRI